MPAKNFCAARRSAAGDERLRLHLAITEAAMDLADVLRQFDTADEDLKVVQLLGMRTFNAFGGSVKLALSGYSQNSALILRDVLETVFLIDYFAGDRTLIERWRFADKKARLRDFGPVKVREALDARDGFTNKKRFAMYEMFSELAGHPTILRARRASHNEVRLYDAAAARRRRGHRPVHGDDDLGSRRLRNGSPRDPGWRTAQPVLSSPLGAGPSEPARLRQAQAALDRNFLPEPQPCSTEVRQARRRVTAELVVYDPPDIRAQTRRQKPGSSLGGAGCAKGSTFGDSP